MVPLLLLLECGRSVASHSIKWLSTYSDSEDAQRGRELRCTYGLAAVREEAKRHKASCVRRAWALIDPTGEARSKMP